MIIRVTDEVARHKVNDNYQCVMVEFQKEDSHFFWDQRNWLPKDIEVAKLTKLLYLLSPTFKEWLLGFIKEQEGENGKA